MKAIQCSTTQYSVRLLYMKAIILKNNNSKISQVKVWQMLVIQQDLTKRWMCINLRDINAIEELESMCRDRVWWKA